jgi:hypothetical protein
MILIKEIKELFVDLNISDGALGDDELFGIEVDIFSDTGKTVFLFALCFGTFFEALCGSKAFSVASSELA